jgi:thioesterase domain-containing protein
LFGRQVNMLPKELEDLLKKEIPLSRHLGFSVSRADDLSVEVKASLQANINHKKTVFGGSQYALCALAAYALFLKNAESRNIVIADGKIKYLKPVPGDFLVRAKIDQQQQQDFLQTLKNKKKARMQISCEVIYQNQVCSHFHGDFVAFSEN